MVLMQLLFCLFVFWFVAFCIVLLLLFFFFFFFLVFRSCAHFNDGSTPAINR